MKILFINIILLLILATELSGKSTFSEETIKNAVISYLNDNYSEDYEYEFLSQINEVSFIHNDVRATIKENNESAEGNIGLTITFKSENRILKYLNVNVKLKNYIKVPVAVRTIPKNSVLTQNDIEFKEITDKKFDDNEINTDLMIGKKLNRNISKGQIIQSNYLSEENLINRGDKVLVIVKSGAVSIKASGTALEDGTAGQRLRVMRDGSAKKVLEGTVQNDATILIDGSNNLQGYLDVRAK